MPKIAIIGTTSWGKTLGAVLANKGLQVILWARTEEETAELRNGEASPNLLPGILPHQLSITSSLSEALNEAQAVILAVPSQTVRQNIRLAKDHLNRSMLVISAAKGLELGSNKRMSEVIAEEIPPDFQSNICVLSGPNLSREIIRDLPAATVVAAVDEAVAQKAQRLLSTANFCVYTNTD
ncbi:unnamed protein product, partial [marine sediment metagenome]